MSALGDVRLLTTSEAAALYRVDRGTVNGWVYTGFLLLACRTPGGHLRVFEAEVDALLAGKPAAEAREIALADQARMLGEAVR